MKRFLAAGTLAALLVALVVSVQAGQTVQYKRLGPVTWLTNIGSDVQTDSTAIYAPNAADVQDTSAVIVLPDDFGIATDIDSLPTFVLSASRSVAAASGDTLYGIVQTSVDGVNFTEPTWLPVYTLVSGTALSGTQSYRMASSYAKSTNWINVAPGGGGVRAVRVRLYADGSAATTGNGTIKVWLDYLSNEQAVVQRNR